MEMSLVLRLPREMHLCRSSSNVPRLPSFLKMLQTRAFFSILHRSRTHCAYHTKCSEAAVLCTFLLPNVLGATTACTFSTSQLPKVLRAWGVLRILTWVQNPLRLSHETMLEHQTVVRTWCACGMFTSTCASRHNGVHFLYISAAKTAPDLKRFVHVDLEICFAPERRALFEHLNSQKRSDTEVLLAFSLRTCIFCTSQLPKLLRSWSVLYILTWNCASYHNGLHIFNISTSKSAPGLKHFVHFHLKMWFAPQRCALFQHLNFQKCSEPRCDFHMLISKCALRQSRAHFLHISTSKSASNPDVFGLLASKSASLQFSISHHPRWLRTRRSSEPTFRRSGATKYWKNTVFRGLSAFSHVCPLIFFLLTLSLLTLSLA